MADVKEEDYGKEGETPWKGPSSANDPKARRWMSSTAASLMDNQEDDDEEVTAEPELQTVSESASDETRDGVAQLNETETSEHGTVDNIVSITESMTGMLCPIVLEGADGVVAVKLNPHHRRMSSETDLLQKKLASHCGSCLTSKETGVSGRDTETAVEESRTMLERNDTLKNSGESSHDEPVPTIERTDTLTRKGHPANCTGFNLFDLRAAVAIDILAILGSSTGVAAEWFTMLGTWLVPNPRDARHHGARRVFRNRCGVRTAQAQRMKELWYKWHSTSSEDNATRSCLRQGSNDWKNADPNMPPFRLWSLAVTKSLDDADWVTPIPGIVGSQSLTSNNGKVSIDDIQVSCSATPLPTRQYRTEELYYDSDPETFRVSRNSPTSSSKNDDYIKKKPLRWRRDISIPSPIDTAASMGSKDVGDRPLAPKYSKGKRAPSFDVVSFDDTEERFDLCDDELVKEFIKDLTTDKVKLLWHPSADDIGKNDPSAPSSTAPISVEGWFEMGSRLYNTVIQPKFMWRETYQPNLLNHKRLGISCQSPHALDLLNIIRILKPSSLDRSAYPFAKLDRTFTILSHTNEQYVFEANNVEERDWLVHGLKLVVARLASMIIVGDEHMFVEFFSPWANSSMMTESSEEQEPVYAEEEKPEQPKSLFLSTTAKDRENLWGAW